MDLTILVVGLILGVGIPLRNKVIKEYRKNKGNKEKWRIYFNWSDVNGKRNNGYCNFGH